MVAPPYLPPGRAFASYTTVRLKIRFRDEPPIGWLPLDMDRVRRVERDPEGNVFINRRYWRAMIVNAIVRYRGDIYEKYPDIGREIYAEDTRLNVPALQRKEAWGQTWEQLPRELDLETTVNFPAVISVDDFKELLVACGSAIGLAPVGRSKGIGTFDVVDVKDITRRA